MQSEFSLWQLQFACKFDILRVHFDQRETLTVDIYTSNFSELFIAQPQASGYEYMKMN